MEKKKDFSRSMRKHMTAAEEKLWSALRNRKCAGLKFRRQQVIEGYIADFYCESIKLCVEADGGIHDQPEQKNIDEERNNAFNSRGVCVMRFKNEEILDDVRKVLSAIRTFAGNYHKLQKDIIIGT